VYHHQQQQQLLVLQQQQLQVTDSECRQQLRSCSVALLLSHQVAVGLHIAHAGNS